MIPVPRGRHCHYLEEQSLPDRNQSGFDTVKLRVRLFRKFSVPFFALIMALTALQFWFQRKWVHYDA